MISFLLFLAFLCAAGGLGGVRISLIFPLSFHRRRMSIDAAWELTRGHFWLLRLLFPDRADFFRHPPAS